MLIQEKSGNTNSDDYVLHGMRLNLPDDYSSTELPEWRAVLFSIALPFPASGLPPAQISNRFVELGDQWIEGRFRGIQRITTPIEYDGAYVAPDYSRDGQNMYDFTPRSFHPSASSRFKGPLADSVGSIAADVGLKAAKGTVSNGAGAVVKRDAENDSESTRHDEENTHSHRYLFDTDTYAKSHISQDNPGEGQPPSPTAKYRIHDEQDFNETDPAPDRSESACPSVSLVCTEFLQYRGTVTHRYHEYTKESEAGELAHDFLVIHVLAENCSGKVLERVSHSLHRIRNVVEIDDWDSNTSHSVTEAPQDCLHKKKRGIKLLPFFVNQAVNALNKGRPNTGNASNVFRAHAHKGGWLAGGHNVSDVVAPVRPATDLREPLPVWRSNGTTQPLRIVCGIPGDESVVSPPMFHSPDEDQSNVTDEDHSDETGETVEDAEEPAESESTWAWHEFDQWAWVLGSGADAYAEGIPRYTSETEEAPDRSPYEYWTMVPTVNGTGIIRNGSASSHDARPWILSSTRFMDLALLVHRSNSMLGNIGERLRAIRFSTASPSRQAGRCDDPDDEAVQLTRDLNTFQFIQSDFVRFRDRLWFDAVPDREFDTNFMVSLRKSTGTMQRYEDVKDELDLRQNVYSTQFNSRQIELDREQRQRDEELARQKQVEREDQQRQKDRDEQVRQERDRELQVALGFLAIIFALPGLVQLLPEATSIAPFIVTTIIIIVLIAGAGLYFKRKTDRRNRPNSTDTATP